MFSYSKCNFIHGNHYSLQAVKEKDTTRNSEIRRKLPKDSRSMRNRIGKKKSEEKEQKKCFEEKIVDAPFPVVDAP